MYTIDRRVFLTALAAGAATAHPLAALAQGVNLDDLYAPGQLAEMAIGAADAPVKVVEYGSFSCPHCAHFHNDILDAFKLKYVDSGKVRFIFRSFLRNGVDVAITAVARCAPTDKFFDVVAAFFKDQDKWGSATDLKQAIFDESKPFGFTEDSFNACLSNKSLMQAFDTEMKRAESFGVTGTPTFFVNGQKEVGALPMEDWDRIIEPMLASAG